MVEKKDDITRNGIVKEIARYIKEIAKGLDDNHPTLNVPMVFHNWYCGCGRDKKWSNDEIKFNRTSYKFREKELGEEGFISIVEDALKMSGCKGKVKTHEWEEVINHGYHANYIKHKTFDELMVISKTPCKEFKLLQRTIKKYADFELPECALYSVGVCGKRTDWNESGDANYLDFDRRNCQRALDFIKGKRTTKDSIECRFGESLHKGEFYKNAMERESEWYGCFEKYLEINIFTPKGKNKGNLKVCGSYSY